MREWEHESETTQTSETSETSEAEGHNERGIVKEAHSGRHLFLRWLEWYPNALASNLQQRYLENQQRGGKVLS